MTPGTEGDTQTGGRPRPPASLRAASFNVRTGLGRDGRHTWPLRSGACAASIAGLAADVVGLQEVACFQERGLARRLPGYAGAGAGRADGRGRGERCTVVYRIARLRARARGRSAGSRTRRGAGVALVGQPDRRASSPSAGSPDLRTGDRFGVANAHWDGASAASRLRSAEALLDWLDPTLPWVVVGDLNATAGDPSVARLSPAACATRWPTSARAALGRHPPPLGRRPPTARASTSSSSGRLGRARRASTTPDPRPAAVGPLAGGRGRLAAQGQRDREGPTQETPSAARSRLARVNVVIRPLRTTDRPAAARLLDDLVGPGFWDFTDADAEPLLRRRDRRARGRRRACAARAGGRSRLARPRSAPPRGLSTAGDPVLHVQSSRVAPRARRGGLASRLLARAETEASARRRPDGVRVRLAPRRPAGTGRRCRSTSRPATHPGPTSPTSSRRAASSPVRAAPYCGEPPCRCAVRPFVKRLAGAAV